MINFIITYFLIVNISAFAICGFDKYFSKNDMYRVPEKTLLLFCVFGGAPGFYIGMNIFRHKTKKSIFKIGVPVIILIWLAAAAAILFI